MNRGKKSLTIDISRPEGQALVRRLAQKADIVLENFKAGDLWRYGLDYASLSALNPRLVYCSITGFGQTGPYAQRAGYDFLIQGMGGLMSVTGRRDGEPGAGPQKVGVALTDILTGLYAVIGVLAALNHRSLTGEGQHIDLALLDVQVSSLANQALNFLTSGDPPRRMGNAHPNIVPYQDFPTADGDMIIAVGNDRQFAALCGVLGHPEWAADLEVLEQDVRIRCEPANDRLPFGPGEIDRERLLVAIGAEVVGRFRGRRSRRIGEEGRPPGARLVARAGPLDLDDLGAEIAEHLSGPRAGEDPRQVEHFQVGEGAGHRIFFAVARGQARRSMRIALPVKIAACSSGGMSSASTAAMVRAIRPRPRSLSKGASVANRQRSVPKNAWPHAVAGP
jgi:hypothetical protein